MKRTHTILALLGALALAAAPAGADGVDFPVTVPAGIVRTYPYSMAGQLVFTSGDRNYQGSGTVVFKRSVLTAAHNVWNPDTGWSTNVEFNRARSGFLVASRQFTTRLFVSGSYRTAAAQLGVDSTSAFASDMAGLRFSAMPAGGGYAGWRADFQSLFGATANICLGYGAELHGGDELLAVQPALGFFPTAGAFMENSSLAFESGMSGGPVFAEVTPGDFRVVAVIVAGSADPPAGGIRALDATGVAFIRTYLQY